MIKWSSVSFVCFIIMVVGFAIISSFFHDSTLLVTGVNISAIGLLVSGVLLIIGLILDRQKDAREEKKNNDEYRHY